MRIAGVGSALPENRFQQQTLTDALKNHWDKKLDNPALMERMHARAGVDYRYLAFSLSEYEKFSSWGESNAAWFAVAEELGGQAIERALARAGFARRDLSAIIVTSITGIASPSLDARLINRMELAADIKRTPIFGLGCVGGAVAITRAADHVRAHPGQVAALLAVEICSLTLQLQDFSTANLIATGLFADGAASAIVAGTDRGLGGPEILGTRSCFYPNTEDIMGWEISERGFQVVLSPRLPALIRERLGADVDEFLHGFGLSRTDIRSWVMHPGGPRVLDAVQEALALTDRDLTASWDCLSRHGNLSSASVLMVLEEVMTNRRPTSGTPGMIVAMGPGFCAEFILLRW
jgi:alkylresorcinol/alkylpyrone synthase